MHLKESVALVASGLTLLQFLSGGFICQKIIQQKSTGSISALPFICGILSTGSWLTYSIMLDDIPMILTNGVGVFTQVLFLSLYSFYCVGSSSRVTLVKQIIALLSVAGTIGYYILYSGTNYKTVKLHVGLMCCAGSILFCASPLASLAEVVRNKSTASLPFPLISLMFLVAVSWSAYGHLIKNTFVFLPNFICAMIAAFQLLLFVIYPRKTTSMKGVVT